MATKVTVTKAEREALQKAVEFYEHGGVPCTGKEGKLLKAMKGFLTKVDERAAIPAAPGLSFSKFTEVIRAKLGRRLVLPPNPTPAWYAIQGSKIRATGITEEQAKYVALGASGMRFPDLIPLELIISRITGLMAQGQARSASADDRPTGFGRSEDE